MTSIAARRSVPRGGLPWVLLIGAASAVASVTRAQTRSSDFADYAGWLPAGPAYVAPSLVSTWVFSNNVTRVPDSGSAVNGAKPESSGLFEIIPEVRLALPYSRSRLELDFRPSYRHYSRLSLPENYAHDLSARNALVLSNGMELDAALTRSRGTFERNDFDKAGQVNFSTTPYRSTNVNASWSWTHPSHWSTVFSIEGADYSFDNHAERGTPQAPVGLLFDSQSTGGYLDLEWIVRPKLTLLTGLGRSREKVDVIGDDLNNNGILDPGEEGLSHGGDLLSSVDRFQQDDLRLGLRGGIGPRLYMDGTIAHSTLVSLDTGLKEFSGFTTLLDSRFQLTRTSELLFQFDRQPQQTLTSSSDVFVYRSIRAGWTATGLRNSFSVAARSIVSRLPDRRENFLSIESSWSLRVRRWTTLRVSINYTGKDSSGTAFDYDELRAGVGWAVGWF